MREKKDFEACSGSGRDRKWKREKEEGRYFSDGPRWNLLLQGQTLQGMRRRPGLALNGLRRVASGNPQQRTHWSEVLNAGT